MTATDRIQGEVIAGSVTAGVAAFVAVLLRIQARRLRGVPLAMDDYSIIAAVPLCWGIVTGNIFATRYGLGHNAHTLSLLQLVNYLKVFFAIQVLWAAAIFLVKLSILMQYLRIFGVMRYMRICTWSVIALSTSWGIMGVIVLLTKCQPMAFNWNKSIDGRCIDEVLFYKVAAGIIITGDLCILLLPMPAIWSLNLPVSKKLQTAGIFITTSTYCAFSVVRFISLFKIKGVDPTRELTMLCVWSAVEPCLGIVAPSLAMTGPLIELWRRKLQHAAS